MNRLEIVNNALAMVGEPPITSIAQTHPRAERALILFAPTLKRFLREHTWNFAKARTTLTPATPAPEFEWDEQFDLPADFVSLVQLNGVSAGPSKVGEMYEIEGLKLLADTATAEIQYVFFPSETEMDDFCESMDALAVDAFGTLLASKLANPLTRDSADLGRALYQQYVSIDLSRARTKDAAEQKLPTQTGIQDSLVIRSRYTGGDTGFTVE